MKSNKEVFIIFRLIPIKRQNCNDPCRIYEKYADFLLTLATALLNDVSTAEDIVHSVFVSFAESICSFELKGSLKSYLAVCVANCARNANKAKQRQNVTLDEAKDIASNLPGPDKLVTHREELQQLADKMQLLPYEQRETIILHLKGEMKFKEIANLQDVSINTVQSRYRYGLEKLRTLFNEEMTR